MAQIIGYVTAIDGDFKAVESNGIQRNLSVGDPIYSTDKMVGDGNSNSNISVSINAQNKTIELAGNEPLIFDDSLLATGFADEELAVEVASIYDIESMVNDTSNSVASIYDIEGMVNDTSNSVASIYDIEGMVNDTSNSVASIYDIEGMVNDTSNSVASIYDIESIMNDTAAGEEKVQTQEETQNQFSNRTAGENDYESNLIDATFAKTQETQTDTQNTTLVFDTQDNGIDFANINENILDLNGKNMDAESATLSLKDVVELTDSNNTLTILGDDADKVKLLNSDGESWSKNADSVEENGHTFDIYANSGDTSVELRVEVNIVDSII